MTLSKLSLRNAKRQAQDYLVYFVTIVMAAALVYAFNGLVFSQQIRQLSSMMASMPLVIVLASIVVVCIIGWLVQYTTGFMLRRRSRELGTYILTGLESRQVAQLFFLENLAVGAIALILGTLLGNLIFQILRAVMLSLFHVPYVFSLAVSWKAAGLTLVYFALIYLFALLKSRKRIQSMKICDLIYFDQQNEKQVITKRSQRKRTFAVSIVFGVVGTVLLLLRSLLLGIVGAGLIIVFLYGFFISFSSGVPAYFETRPAKKYTGQTLLIFRSLCAKLATMGVVMATIALLFTATLLSEGSGMLFHAMFQSRNEQTTCFDLFIGSTGHSETQFDEYLAYINSSIPVDASWQYQIYAADSCQVMEYVSAHQEYYPYFDYDTLMKQSDYAALRAMLGYPAVELEPGQYVVHCMDYLAGLMSDYRASLSVDGKTLVPGGVYTEPFTQSLWDGNGRGYLLVVPDSAVADRSVSHSIYAAMTSQPVPEVDYNALRSLRDSRDQTVYGYDTLFSKAAVEAENASLYATIVFPLFYLALVLTMVSATILTIQQLSEAGRYQRQCARLGKLGMDLKDMKRALRWQFAIYYTMPAIPPLFIGVPFIAALGGSLDPGVLAGVGQILRILGVTLGIFFFIYLVYITVAYLSLKRTVLPEAF